MEAVAQIGAILLLLADLVVTVVALRLGDPSMLHSRAAGGWAGPILAMLLTPYFSLVSLVYGLSISKRDDSLARACIAGAVLMSLVTTSYGVAFALRAGELRMFVLQCGSINLALSASYGVWGAAHVWKRVTTVRRGQANPR